MESLRLIIASLLLLTASAVSNGNLPVCNVDMAIGAGTSVMKWVQPPVASSMYTITSPASTYTPGGLTPITITVTDLDYIYIGLLLVAVAGPNATLTGQWTVLDGDDFFLPATCKFAAVVHSNADLKPIQQTFYWKGAAGTGDVTFRALIKQGEQNHGNFYKPANLVLQEKTTGLAAQTVWKGESGDSCDETCGKQSMACDQAGTLALNTPSILQTKVQDFYACRQPYLKACAPPATGANSYCFASSCAGTQTFDSATTCSRRSADPNMNQQFCACKAGTVVRDPPVPTSDATATLGLHLSDPLQLDPELTLNSLEIQGGNVTIDISGPQDRWFAIGWDAAYMNGAYATVVWLNNPAIRPPQNYDLISDKGYVDSAQGWYDARCQQALNDYCRNVGGSPKWFSCALANSTNQGTGIYNASNNMTFSANLTSRVPCKGGKIAPFLPMTVAEYRLSDNPRNATLLPPTITPIRSLVDAGRFRIVFTRPIAGNVPFPNKKSMNLIWSMGIQQFFGKTVGGTFIKHAKKSDTLVTLNLVPLYGTCPPSTAPTGTGISAASFSGPSTLLVPALAALGSKSWTVGLGALFALLVRPAAAHNWMNTPSRAQIASVNIPCQSRVDPAPHLQVVPGQKFQMEWSTGHGDTPTIWTYFVFLKEEDYNELIDVTDSMLDDYLAKAPSYITGDEWTRRHLSPWANYINGCLNCNNGSQYPTTFAQIVNPTDLRYITRNSVAIAKSLQAGDRNVTQFWYPSDMLSGDSRAEYQSAKYPWILSVHKFRIAAHWPNEYDIATFAFPAGLPTGNYIAHFKWGGYRDCTDVNIMAGTTTVVNPWGLVQSANTSATFTRLDHCEYTFVLNPATKCTKMVNGNASQCLADCLKLSGTYGCTGVQAVLKTNPAGTLPYTPNYPYKKYTRNDTAFLYFPPPEYGPCDSRTIQKRRNCPDIQPTCNDTFLNTLSNTDYLCYGLVPYRDQDFQTVDDYVITTDPSDPGFYSTCWVRLAPGGFLPYPQPKKPAPVWRTGQQCISCDWLKNTYPTFDANTAPNWAAGLTTDCRDCDIELATSCAANVAYVEGGHQGNCTGQIIAGQTCSTQCDPGFKQYGAARVCNNGVLTGAAQGCTFEGC